MSPPPGAQRTQVAEVPEGQPFPKLLQRGEKALEPQIPPAWTRPCSVLRGGAQRCSPVLDAGQIPVLFLRSLEEGARGEGGEGGAAAKHGSELRTGRKAKLGFM